MKKDKAFWRAEAEGIERGNLVMAKIIDQQSEELLLTRQAVKDNKQLSGIVEMLTDLLLTFWLYHTAGAKPANCDIELVREYLIEQGKVGVLYHRKNPMQAAFEDALKDD